MTTTREAGNVLPLHLGLDEVVCLVSLRRG